MFLSVLKIPLQSLQVLVNNEVDHKSRVVVSHPELCKWAGFLSMLRNLMFPAVLRKNLLPTEVELKGKEYSKQKKKCCSMVKLNLSLLSDRNIQEIVP